MKLDYALIANAAELLPNGLMYVLGGGIDIVTATKFPAGLPFACVLVKMRFDQEELDREHKFLMQIVQPSGLNLSQYDSTLTFVPTRHPTHPERSWQMICSRLTDLVFPEAGDYKFCFFV